MIKSLAIIGIHLVPVSEQQFRDAVNELWGENLAGEELGEAEENARQHFESLYLIEIEIDPPGAEIDWAQITQPLYDKPRDSWQVPYDERPLDESGKRWAFFFHFLDYSKPLLTPIGDIKLPATTPVPTHLIHIRYELP